MCPTDTLASTAAICCARLTLSTGRATSAATTPLCAAPSTSTDVLLDYPRSQAPLDWAAMQNNLGTALERLGERESGTARLEQAVAAFRAALQERTRARVPLDWAQTQMNSRPCALEARGAGERDGAAGGGGRGLSRGARGIDARAGSARLGGDADESRRCAHEARRAGERDGAARAARPPEACCATAASSGDRRGR